MEELLTFIQELTAIPGVQALLVVAGSVILALIADRLIVLVLRRLAARTKTELDDQIIGLLHRPIFVTVVLLGLSTALAMVQPPPMVGLVLSRLIKTVIVVMWTTTLLSMCKAILVSSLKRPFSWIDPRILLVLDNVGKVVLVGLALYSLLLVWNLDVAPWLATAGIGGIALGFAAKDTLANLFGGIFVIADSPYKLGDFIILDSGERGRVTTIGLRSTRILTRDDIEIIIPNAQIANAKIINESGGPWEKERVTAVVGVAYGSDIDQVRRVLVDCASSVDHVVDDPEPRVRFTEFGDSALIFRLMAWIDEPVLRGATIDALNTAIYKRFQQDGIAIPFPQRDVHIKGGAPG